MYHRVGRSLLKISGPLLISLPQQTVQIITDESSFFCNPFQGRKSSGRAKAASVRKLDLSQLCFSLNFYFPMFLLSISLYASFSYLIS